MQNDRDISQRVIDDFGNEWEKYDQSGLSEAELGEYFEAYFHIFPKERLTDSSVGADFGGGTGRWSKYVAPQVARLHFVEPSKAMAVARRKLASFANVVFHQTTIEECPIEDGSLDFAYSLGVLHHIPDTQNAMNLCTAKLKPGAPFLVYLYYVFEDKSRSFKLIWKISDLIRGFICRQSEKTKIRLTTTIAALVYFPLARTCKFLSALGLNTGSIPLSFYRDASFYTMRTDARDRFGTTLEKRYSREDITRMMETAGLTSITISELAPYWCAVGIRR